MAKELTLTISERTAATRLFDEFKGNLSVLAKVMEDVKAVLVTDEEWLKADLKKTPSDEEVKNLPPDSKVTQKWEWKEEGLDKVVSISQEGVDYLRAKIKEKNEAGEFTLAPQDRVFITLADKVN